MLRGLGAEFRKKSLNVIWDRENWYLKKSIYNCQERNLLAAPKRTSLELEKQSPPLKRRHHYSPNLPCNTHTSHRRYPQESRGRCMAEDADCARILPPPPSATGWPSPYPFHSYVLQTGLLSNRQSIGTCPLKPKWFGRLETLSTFLGLLKFSIVLMFFLRSSSPGVRF